MQTVQSELTAADHRNRQANKKISRQANRIQWLLTQRKMSLLALEKNAAQVKQLQCIANRIKLKGTISLSRPLDTFDAGRGSFDPQNSAHRKQKSRASIRAVRAGPGRLRASGPGPPNKVAATAALLSTQHAATAVRIANCHPPRALQVHPPSITANAAACAHGLWGLRGPR